MALDGSDETHVPGELLPRPDPTRLTTDQLRREIGALREVITSRLDGMDRAFDTFTEGLHRTPTEIEKQVAHLRELCWERFDSITLQFAARDEKVEALATSAAAALRAALESAEKLSNAHTEAALLANAKTESAFGEQIKALEDKIEVNTRALDKGAFTAAGALGQRSERRLDYGQVIAALAVIVAVAAVIISVFHK